MNDTPTWTGRHKETEYGVEDGGEVTIYANRAEAEALLYLHSDDAQVVSRRVTCNDWQAVTD